MAREEPTRHPARQGYQEGSLSSRRSYHDGSVSSRRSRIRDPPASYRQHDNEHYQRNASSRRDEGLGNDARNSDYYESRASSYLHYVPDSPIRGAAEGHQLEWNVSNDGIIVTGVAERNSLYYSTQQEEIKNDHDNFTRVPSMQDFYDDYQQNAFRLPARDRLMDLNSPPLPATCTDSWNDCDYGSERCDPYWQRNNDHHASARYHEHSLKKSPPPTAPAASTAVKTIEISPGVHVRLRGADETYKAVQVDFYVPCQCFCCENLTIFCIQDADYVVCPSCKTVNPMEGRCSNDVGEQDGGVGLGFTMESLADMQGDIARSRVASY